jgi:hypothetical protein
MAQQYNLPSGGTLIVPDSSVTETVQNNPVGISLAGVLALVGEANSGPSFSQDIAAGNALSQNFYGSNDLNRVIAKYGSGNLVDAFRAGCVPSASKRITGSPAGFILVKTNDSTKAGYSVSDGSGTFLAARGGADGNNIQVSVSTTQAESAPTTGAFTYAPSTSTSSAKMTVNGGTVSTFSIPANTTPPALAAIFTTPNSNAVGGVNENLIAAPLIGIDISVTSISGLTADIVLATGSVFSATPAVGDTLYISATSVIKGSTNGNVGWWVVTGIVNSTVDATISVTQISGGMAPVAVAPVAIASITTDAESFSALTINNMSGTNRDVLQGQVGNSITTTVIGSVATFTNATPNVFNANSSIGDIMYIPAGSAYQGAGNANVGWYQVTSVSNTIASSFIQAQRLSNGLPLAVASTPIVAITDLEVYDPQIAGYGKSMEIWDGGGTANISTEFLDLTNPSIEAPWVGSLITSAAELEEQITVLSPTSTPSTYTVGGNIAMTLGYEGTSASTTIGLVSGILTLTTTVVGGIGGNLSINLSTVATIGQLVSLINANPGYIATSGSVANSLLNPSVLDESTYGINSAIGHQPGRIKNDLWEITGMSPGLNVSNGIVDFVPTSTAGLPSPFPLTYLSGGQKGGTSGLQAVQAIDALQAVQCNFVVPLFSQNASLDIAQGKTDPSSTYTINAINAAAEAHVLQMSTPTIKRHRVALCSYRGSFLLSQEAAQNISSFRVGMCFQDILNLNSLGAIAQFQPWMASTLAAAMQAAGQYKSIFNKNLNISGEIDAFGDFDDQDVTQVETALLAGLLPITRQVNGGYTFASDQMTYSTDGNVIYNSLQAVYVADIMALSLAASLRAAFLGESIADVTQGTVESFVKAQLAAFLTLKLVASTAAAPAGYTNIDIQIVPPALLVNVTVVEATSLYFIPINLYIQTATS